MRILERLSGDKRNLAAALGTFDGVHLGHSTLLDKTVRTAQAEGLESAVLTFANHPMSVLLPGQEPPFLADKDEKRRIFALLGVEQLAEVPFTRQLAALSPEAFIREYLLPACVERVFVGYNFRFGSGGAGDAVYLEKAGNELGFTVEVLPPVEMLGGPVSSSRIRAAVASGDMGLAEALLGRPYRLRGIIRAGFFFPEPGAALPGDGAWHAAVLNASAYRVSLKAHDGRFELDGLPEGYEGACMLVFEDAADS